MTVAPQAVASLAADARISLPVAFAKLQHFFQSLGVHCMADTAAATAAALQFACSEFMSVFNNHFPPDCPRQAAALKLRGSIPADAAPMKVPLPPPGSSCTVATGWSMETQHGEIAFSSGASTGPAPGRKVSRGGRPQWNAPPVTLAISSTRTKIIPDGNIKSVNLADDGGPIVNLDGGASAPGVVVDSSTGAAVDIDGKLLQLTGPAASSTARAEEVRKLCAAASVPLPGIPAGVTGLPLLASACPGWVCYAEKTHPAALAHISRVKSPQALAGQLVKSTPGNDVLDSSVYHAALMPCFDKKLEASRRDMYSETGGEGGVKLVDCVITPEEVGALLLEKGFSCLAEVPTPDVPASTAAAAGAPTSGGWAPLQWAGGDLGGAVVESDASGSGGYAAAVLRHGCAQLLGVTLEGPLPWKEGRNSDLRSVSVSVDGQQVLSVATAYGFRNIQTVVTRMKTGKCTWDYVEAMACGGGCPNGGGQLRVRASEDEAGDAVKATPAQQRTRVEEVNALLQTRVALPAGAAQQVSAALNGCESTTYHAMPAAGTSGAVAW